MPSQNEVSMLRDDITKEVNSTAEVLGKQLFAGNADTREPDIAHVNQQRLEDAYRQKFLAQDREWLAAEAQRDPQQFMKVAQKIGVVDPRTLPNHTPPMTPEMEAKFQAGPPAPPAAPPAVPPPMDPSQVQAALPQVMPPPMAPPAPPIAPQAPPPMIPPPGMLPPQV